MISIRLCLHVVGLFFAARPKQTAATAFYIFVGVLHTEDQKFHKGGRTTKNLTRERGAGFSFFPPFWIGSNTCYTHINWNWVYRLQEKWCWPLPIWIASNFRGCDGNTRATCPHCPAKETFLAHIGEKQKLPSPSREEPSFFSIESQVVHLKGNFFFTSGKRSCRGSVFHHYLIVIIIFASELCSG